MHRTNLYLTEEQERALDARAKAQGVSRSAVVREILDRELAAPSAPPPELGDALAALADLYLDRFAVVFDNDPDLSIES
jgi:hypothetical protein